LLAYASAGHPTAYLLDASGKIKTMLPRTGVPLGIRPDTTYVSSPEMLLEPGDIFFVLTDGIEEAMSPNESIFGIDRALDVVRANSDKPAREIVEALYQAVRQFSHPAPQLDDVTAIVLKVLPI